MADSDHSPLSEEIRDEKSPKEYQKKSSGSSVAEKDEYIKSQTALILQELDDGKAEEVLKIDLAGKTALCDFMIFASANSSRAVQSLADRVYKSLSQNGFGYHLPSGRGETGWVLIDTGDVIVHIFQSETRKIYGLDRMWSGVARSETE